MTHQRYWVLVEATPDQSGADAVRRVIGMFAEEDDALAMLAECRDDDPETGDGWTCAEMIVWYPLDEDE